MVKSDEAWTESRTKLKAPGRMGRRHGASCGFTQIDAVRYTGGQALLGEPLWRPTSPKGFPDDEASWIDGMGRRLDIATMSPSAPPARSIPTRSSAACWRP